MGCQPVYTIAHPVLNPTIQGTGFNSAHPFVSSQVTAPSIHSAAPFMRHNSQASFVSQLYPTGVAPVNFSATSVSQPTRYSMSVFHTQAVPGSTPTTTQGSANYGTIASNGGQRFQDKTFGADSDPNHPRNLFPRDQYTPQQNGFGQSGYPQQHTLNHTSYGPPSAVINKLNYHHLKEKDMEVPKYKGFNDHRTPNDFLLELDKFQTWWGGWWERLIRIVKDLLRRTLGNRRLDGVQLETCLCEVEATMNKRPLTYVTEDSADLIPLTPQMFMTDQSDTNFPRVENLDSDELRRRYKTLGNLKEELRSRFRKEYLAELVHKGKSKDVQEFRVGDVILVGDDNMKRQDWPIARIEELGVGADGHCRLARVKSFKGVFMRPLQKLFRLEVGSADSIPKPKPPKNMQDVIYDPVERTRCGRKVKKPKDY